MTLTKKISPAAFFSIVAGFAVAAMLLVAGVAHANPSQFTSTASTASATTTVAYQTPGTATSTLVYDTLQANGTNQNNVGNNYATTKTQILIQFTASSTNSKLNINVEYSQDGVDWYQDAATNLNGYATTTLPVSLTPVPQYQWAFASSTVGQQGVSASNNRDLRSLSINVPTRYARVIFTCAIGGTNCGVWATVVPQKEDK